MSNYRTVFLFDNRALFASLFSFPLTIRKFFFLFCCRLAFFFHWIRFSVFFPSMCFYLRHFSTLVLLFGDCSIVQSDRAFSLCPISPDEFVSLISSPSLFSTGSVLVVPPDISDVRPLFLSRSHCISRVPSRSILTNTPLFSSFRSFSLSRTYTCIHSDAYVPTSPWLNEIRTRVSTGDARDASSVCVTRIRTCMRACSDSSRSHLYARKRGDVDEGRPNSRELRRSRCRRVEVPRKLLRL